MVNKTELKITKSNDLISHSNTLVLLGSCFSDNIGKFLNKYSFNVSYNSIGIVYNPITLSKIIRFAIHEKEVNPEHIIKNNDVYCHFDFHSKYNSLEKEEVVASINKDLKLLYKNLKSCDFLFLTLGTSISYTLKESDEIVGNCHKFPTQKFQKKNIPISEITQSLQSLIADLKAINTDIKIIFTVSPVRHIKEGIVENTQSKARLLTAVSNLQETNERISYFPSYEIMLDELRDYSFYKSDLIHPNKNAIKHIWKLFGQHYFTEKTKALNKKLRRIFISANHKAFHPKSQDHQNFLRKLLTQIEELEKAEEAIQLPSIKKKLRKQLFK